MKKATSLLVSLFTLVAALEGINVARIWFSNASPLPPQTDRVTKKVMLIIQNPILESKGGISLIQFRNWNDPRFLAQNYINDIRTASHGYVNYQLVLAEETDEIPQLLDGYQYTDEAFLDCLSDNTTCHRPERVDYNKTLNSHNVCQKRNSGEIDEVWFMGSPGFGFYESRLAGPNAFYYNSPPLTDSLCQKLLPIMGFSYERTGAEMLEDTGHRVESTMNKVFGTAAQNKNNIWNRFMLRDIDIPGESGCGRYHFGPNGTSDYNWGNTRTVSSYCNDFYNYPTMGGFKTNINCADWNCNGYDFGKWWLGHLPHAPGMTDGKWNNWWIYIVDYEKAVSSTPSPTPKLLCGSICKESADCTAGLVCYLPPTPTCKPGKTCQYVAGVKTCRNPSCLANTNCSCAK